MQHGEKRRLLKFAYRLAHPVSFPQALPQAGVVFPH
jgi:hypothetical protein